ncbi:MAG: PHP domain-containing protein [Promethearchaeota archaeon]
MHARSDTHCHTVYSDGCVELRTLVKLAKRRGFSFVVKTDHNTTHGNGRLGRLCRESGLTFVPGVEVSTRSGHVLGFGVTSWERSGRFSELEAAIHEMRRQGAVVVMAHPFGRHGLRERVFGVSGLDGWEILNGASPLGNLTTLRNQRAYPRDLGRFAGSDSHAGIIYGHYFTEVLTSDFSTDGILEAMRKRLVRPRGPVFPLRYYLHDGLVNQLYQLRRKVVSKRVEPAEFIRGA